MRWLSKNFESLLAELAAHEQQHAPAAGPVTTRPASPPFDVVVVGSGYGGAVAACRFAEAGLRVAVLERGREYLPGEFPNDIAELPGHVRIDRAGHDGPGRTAGGLFDLRLHRGVTLLVGNGLGGGSLINANVALRADAQVFKDARWPRALREQYDPLDAWYTRAEDMLGVAQYTAACRKADQLQRLEAPLEQWLRGQHDGRSDQQPQVRFYRAPLAVNQRALDRNRFGVTQPACTGCGDCVTGCNTGAKNTLTTNYLARAYAHGAVLFTGVGVLAVKAAARSPGEPPSPHSVWFDSSDIDWSPRFSEDRYADEQTLVRLGIRSLAAPIVVLAAGSLGSTEILLRSRQLGLLATSSRLGSAFSGNADGLGFGYDQAEPVAGIALGARGAAMAAARAAASRDALEDAPGVAPEDAPGPAIVGVLDLRGGVDLRDAMLIEDGIVPGALRGVTHEIVTTAAMLQQLSEPRLRHDGPGEDPLALNEKALRHTQVYLAMGHDDADGSMALEGGRLVVTQPESSQAHAAKRQKAIIERAAVVTGAVPLPNPLTEPLPSSLTDVLSGPPLQGQRLVVHPLGGCPMGDDCSIGVVDQYGAVYDGRSPRTVHDSLFVWDGSIVPMSLGANPFLTITALAERAVDRVLGLLSREGEAQALGVAGRMSQPPRELPARRLPAPRAFDDAAAARVPIALRETLRGRLVLSASSPSDPGIAAVLKLRMEVPDMLALLHGAGHRIDKVGGEFRWELPARGPAAALQVVSGSVDVLVQVRELRLLRIVRGLWAWWRKRGSQESGALMRDLLSGRKPWSSLLTSLWLAERAGTRRQFRYALELGTGAEGAERAKGADPSDDSYSLYGVKTVRFATDSNVWESLLDLPVMVRRGRDRVPVARGVLRLDLVDFADRGAPQILGHADAPNGLLAIAGLPLLFLRVILATHLWDFRAPDYRARALDAPIPTQRPLLTSIEIQVQTPAGPRASRSQRHSLTVPWSCGDEGPPGDHPPHLELLLTRLEPPVDPAGPGRRTPVLMLAGFAQSASAFVAEPLQEDLVRHLLARGFDVWLFDYRTSTALPYSRLACSLDDVAAVDIPHAVEYIRRCTRRPRIMAIGHCMGSATLSMAMLSGALAASRLEQLDVPGRPVPAYADDPAGPVLSAAVLSQVPPYVVGGAYSQWRQQLAALFRDVLGVDVVNLSADAGVSAWEAVMDRIFATLPDERHDSQLPGGCPLADPTCRRVAGVIGPLYRHDNVIRMHDSLDQYFGWANVGVFNQIARFFEYERLVSAEGSNAYVTDDNIRSYMRLPIALLHGKENQVFSVESARRTHRHLQRVHGSDAGSPAHETIIVDGYCHFDCLIGDNAWRDVFPPVSAFLERHVDPPDPILLRRAGAASGREGAGRGGAEAGADAGASEEKTAVASAVASAGAVSASVGAAE